jgi:VanZ family protein
MRGLPWLAPVVWMAIILALGSEPFGGDRTGRILGALLSWLVPWVSPAATESLHVLLRKLAHVTEYGILAALWYRALASQGRSVSRRATWGALGISVAWAIVDEARQALALNRTGSALDVAIDAAGAAVGLLLARRGWHGLDRVTAALLWFAAIGGASILLVNTLATVASGLLWITVPAATVVLVARWWHRSR